MYTRESRKDLAAEVRYAYFYVGDGDATLAYVRDGDFLFFGVALCAPSDNFCKDTGRKIALQRLFAGEPQKITLNCEDPKKQAVIYSLEKILPQWINTELYTLTHFVEYRPSKSLRRKLAQQGS